MNTKEQDNPFYSKKIQDILNKMISEEMLADMTYRNALLACKVHDQYKLNRMFQTIANDELSDHYHALVMFAANNGYQIPYQMKEYKKYASDVAWKTYDNMKKEQDVNYYIDLLIESEKDAIQSYKDALKNDDIPYDLYATLQKNFYDECEHLEDLNTLKIAIDANADLAWTNMYEGNQPDYSYHWPWSITYGDYQ